GGEEGRGGGPRVRELVGGPGFVQRVEEVARQRRGQGRGGREKEGELKVNQAEILPAAPAERGAESIEHLGSPRLRRVDQQWEFLAGLDLVHRLDDEWMAGQRFLERGENFQGFVRIPLSREEACISLDHAQRRGIELIGMLEVLRRLLLLTGKIKDQPGMQLLEDRVPIGAG